MKNQRLPKLYSLFDGEERLALVLAALGRGDRHEVERVWSTVPRYRALAPDEGFVDAWGRAVRLAWRFCIPAARWISWLDLLELLNESLDDTLEFLYPDDLDPELSRQARQEPSFPIVGAAARVAAVELRCLRDALEEVCQERLRVGADVLLSLNHPAISEGLARHADALAAVPADPSKVAAHRDDLAAPWTEDQEDGQAIPDAGR
jgi:hypothetical protein